jgi:predicted membrane GTPase involved in stress response
LVFANETPQSPTLRLSSFAAARREAPIVAVNKINKAEAKADRVKTQLSELGAHTITQRGGLR